jgi:thioredoxin-related protein
MLLSDFSPLRVCLRSSVRKFVEVGLLLILLAPSLLSAARDDSYEERKKLAVELYRNGKLSEAKEQFIKAVVAQPYLRISWMGLSQWAQRQKMVLKHPAINPPGKVEDKGKNEKGQNQTNIIIDMSTLDSKAKKDGTDAWFIYSLSKAVWHGERFQKEFPNEKEYRHSLAEELDGFQMVVSEVKEKLKKKEIKQLDPALALLVKLYDEGLLEAFILISKADEGIARDYAGYRDSHRDKVAQYISEWVIQPAQ